MRSFSFLSSERTDDLYIVRNYVPLPLTFDSHISKTCSCDEKVLLAFYLSDGKLKIRHLGNIKNKLHFLQLSIHFQQSQRTCVSTNFCRYLHLEPTANLRTTNSLREIPVPLLLQDVKAHLVISNFRSKKVLLYSINSSQEGRG